jgi:NAD(P)-dependent dehydrogenase (short-subunit alcohol dehydrogenase family)
LGLSLAKHLVKRGISVTILDRQDTSGAVEAVKEAASSSARVLGLNADVSNYRKACAMFFPMSIVMTKFASMQIWFATAR